MADLPLIKSRMSECWIEPNTTLFITVAILHRQGVSEKTAMI